MSHRVLYSRGQGVEAALGQQTSTTELVITLRASCGAVYYNRSCMWVGVCVCVALLPR